MSKRFCGFLLSSAVVLFASYGTAQSSGGNGSTFEPYFYASVGFSSFGSYNDAIEASFSKTLADLELGEVSSTVSFSGASETRLSGGVGMQMTESWGLSLLINELPGATHSFRGEEENARIKHHGWNAQLATVYTFPLDFGASGVRAFAQAGWSQSRIKTSAEFMSTETVEPNDPNPPKPYSLQLRERQSDIFMGLGLSVPLNLMDQDVALSAMFVRKFNSEDDDRAKDAFQVQLQYGL